MTLDARTLLKAVPALPAAGSAASTAGMPRILLVEDQQSIQDLVAAMLTVRKLPCLRASTVAEARRLLAESPFDILLIDVNLPDGSGLSLARDCGPDGPLVIVMTGNSDLQTAIDAIRHGAVDYITKPFSVGDFLQRLDRALEGWRSRASLRGQARALEALVRMKSEELSRSTRRIDEVHDKTVLALGAALNLKDSETGDHCARVSANSVRLGTMLELSAFELKNLSWGAYLHDVGKIGIPEPILLKNGPLSAEERVLMEKHPAMGYDLIRNIEFLVHATDVVIAHHERYDGSGYPHRLAGEQIPLHARIFSLMDTLDAMTSERPYRSALPISRVAEEVARQAGSQFDPDIAAVFLSAPKSTWLVQERGAAHSGAAAMPPEEDLSWK
jgi:response regulator RpfG family c-di-GMP phosphodiesterase